MKVRVLGCYGGEMPGRRSTCFLVNDTLMLDAGAATAALPLKDQKKINAILITHSHLDHIRDIGFLADNIFGKREKPLRIYGLAPALRALREHVLNNQVWPDFSALPNKENPVISFHEIPEALPMEIEGFSVRAFRVNHPVPAAGFIIRNDKECVIFSGDTGPTEELWKAGSKEEDLKAVFLETSFPDRLADLAEASGHLTPSSAAGEMEKLNQSPAEVFLFHMKPSYVKEIENNLKELKLDFQVLRQGDRLDL